MAGGCVYFSFLRKWSKFGIQVCLAPKKNRKTLVNCSSLSILRLLNIEKVSSSLHNSTDSVLVEPQAGYIAWSKSSLCPLFKNISENINRNTMFRHFKDVSDERNVFSFYKFTVFFSLKLSVEYFVFCSTLL